MVAMYWYANMIGCIKMIILWCQNTYLHFTTLLYTHMNI